MSVLLLLIRISFKDISLGFKKFNDIASWQITRQLLVTLYCQIISAPSCLCQGAEVASFSSKFSDSDVKTTLLYYFHTFFRPCFNLIWICSLTPRRTFCIFDFLSYISLYYIKFVVGTFKNYIRAY